MSRLAPTLATLALLSVLLAAGEARAFAPEVSAPPAASPAPVDPLGDAPLQLLVILGLAFATVWLGVTINLSTRRRSANSTRLRTLARRRRRP